MPPRFVALIPARAGSKRVPSKNIRPLRGHPLLAYSIAAARASGVFADVLVSTDSPSYAAIAEHYGAEVPFLRPEAHARDNSPDIEWIAGLLGRLREAGRIWDCFAILRPTNPFRLASTIRRAVGAFLAETGVDSLRAVERCAQHPGKMWVLRGRRMLPLLPFSLEGQPWHSNPYQALPEIHIQNASLEIAWSRVVFEQGNITGTVVMPFLTENREGLDINSPDDWERAVRLATSGEASLPEVPTPPWKETEES